MKILAKLLISFVSIALLCAVVGFVGLNQLSNLEDGIKRLSTETIPALDYLNQIDKSLKDIKVTIRTVSNPLGIDDELSYVRDLDSITKYRAIYAAAKESYEKIPKVAEEAKLYEKVDADFTEAAKYNNEILAKIAKAKSAGAAESAAIFADVYTMIAGDQRLVYDTLQDDLKTLITYDQQYYGVDVPKKLMKDGKTGSSIVLLVTILAFIVAIILGIIQGKTISGRLGKTVRVLDKIAAGDFSEGTGMQTSDEFQQLSDSLDGVRKNINEMTNDTSTLVKAALEGQLSTRADASRHQGGYRKIIEGINATLDAVVTPLMVAANYIDSISKGDLPEKISAEYKGDFNKIKDNLNIAIDSIKALVADANLLADAAIAGELQTRADAGKHQGDYRKIVEGVNQTLDLIIVPMNEVIEVLKHMAEGDLMHRVAGDYRGDFDILKTALNDSLTSINDTMAQVNTAVDQVAEGSVQVSQASQSLSQGATEQASSLEEITSSTTEISSQTRQNTENAVKMNSLAKEAQGNAVKGNEKMKDLVSAMSDINTSAEQIKTVVKAIDDISFQINLLALNANVEAARAGKYGKGFAVVAEEVRNLAVRSANSVKETTRMVDEAISNIQRGNVLVEGTAKQLDEIVLGAAEVSNLAAEVSTAGREQTQGLEQISLGLNQIDQVTQSNTASAEESASASEELSSQAQQVKSMLSRFKLKPREGTSSEMIAMLKAELAGRDAGPKTVRKDAPAPAQSATARKGPVRPSEIISLDDNNFGKF